MGFEEFLPDEEPDEISDEEINIGEERVAEKIGQNQVYDVVTGRKPDWQAIIYELINTEQLDPWDIDIVILTRRYFEKIIELEEKENSDSSDEEPDFYVSSRVLHAAALLLRIKSEFLLNKHLRSIDEILFGRKDDIRRETERIEIDEDELPILMPKTPLSRQRRITLPELMAALNKAINTESRRIKREVAVKRAHQLSHIDIPKFKRIDLKDRIKQFYARILTALKIKEKKPDKILNKVGYSKLVGKEREERLACFLPLLHLSNTQKLWLEQEAHLDEIWIFLYQYFDKNRDKFIEELEEDIEEMREELMENVEGVRESGLAKARRRLDEKRRLEEDVKKELMREIKEIAKEEEIDEISGFADEIE